MLPTRGFSRKCWREGDTPQFVLHHARNLAEATRFLEQNEPDVMLLDMGLPDASGPGGRAAAADGFP